MVAHSDCAKFDVTTKAGLINYLDLHIEMYGNVALTRLIDQIEGMYPEIQVWRPRCFAEMLVTELDNIDIYVVGHTIRVTRNKH